nr:unnamed protein product [Callosobruchus analis]
MLQPNKSLADPLFAPHSFNQCFTNVSQSELRPNKPNLPAPEFNGDLSNWPLFYASFKSNIHNNKSLTDSERLYYLIGKLTGKAKAVFSGLTPCESNYAIIFKTLEAKYQDKRLQAAAYLDNIFDLKPIVTATAENIERLHEKLASSVSALKNLDITNLLDFVFLHIALKRLDSETLRAFEMEHRGSSIPEFDQLLSFLRDQAKILQRSSNGRSFPSNKTRIDAPKLPKQTHSYNRTTANYSYRPNYNFKCALCDNMTLTPHDTRKFIRDNNFCNNCLSIRHKTSFCQSKSCCKKCNRNHHTLLHFESNVTTPQHNIQQQSPRVASAASASAIQPANFEFESHCTTAHSAPVITPATTASSLASASQRSSAPIWTPQQTVQQRGDVTLWSSMNEFSARKNSSITTVLLATARVVVYYCNGKAQLVRCLLDSASQSNFITMSCIKGLGLRPVSNDTTVVVKGIGGLQNSVNSLLNLRIFSRFNSSIYYDLSTLVVNQITENFPTAYVDNSALQYLNEIPLSDENYAEPGQIDLLIGASLFPHLLLPRKIEGPSGLPHAIETVFRYVVLGSAPAKLANFSTLAQCCTDFETHDLVKRFWELEQVPGSNIKDPEDVACEEIYTNTTFRDSDGRYVVTLPFKKDLSLLGDSYSLAKKRCLCLERKLLASPELKKAYDDAIREYLDNGYLAPAPLSSQNLDFPQYFISHHGVIREDKITSKLRVVLDASAKTTDIRQMFLCIGVRKEDRVYQQILYSFTPHDPLTVYQFNRVCME